MACPGTESAEYNDAGIQIYEGLEPIRRRPAMYLGGTDAPGLHHMLFELVRESLEPVSAGSVQVMLRTNRSAEVVDDREPPAQVEHLFTAIHAGLHDNLSCAIANALSAELSVVARSPGSRYHHSFRQGATHAVLQTGGPPDDRGLTVRFRPDPAIFGTASFDAHTVRNRMRQYAFLHSGVRITFTDEASGTSDVFEFADGIREYVQHLNAGRTPLHPDVIVIRGDAEGVRYEVGLQWCAEEDEQTESFANDYRTTNGGAHVTGLRDAVTRTLNDYIRERLPSVRPLTGEAARRGLTAVVSVRLHQPQFWGATRDRLNSPEAERVVTAGVQQFLCNYFEASQDAAARIVSAANMK